MDSEFRPNSSHWGTFLARDSRDGIELVPHPDDPHPTELLDNIASSARHPTRIRRPVIREGWLRDGPGPSRGRGSESFVEVTWEKALSLAAEALRRAYGSPEGARSVFGGSYGWSSAGRFHHAQSQVHRFLNTLGGYVASRNTYSSAAGEVILGRVLQDWRAVTNSVTWPDIVANTELVVSFGGLPLKNSVVAPGGISKHVVPEHLADARRRGCDFVLVSPIRDDLPESVEAENMAIHPGTDVALMLAIAYTLIREDRVDLDFLDRCAVGYEVFERYVIGESDNQPKTPAWAEHETGISAESIVDLARRMSSRRTLITVAYALQRSEHGEQPVWMGVTLAAMLGQIGTPGGGFTFALGAMGHIGRPRLSMKIPSLPQGRNQVEDFIPVARISDLLLHPREQFDYDGRSLNYADIRLVYWAGGNPFHHHQDLNRLRRALEKPDTIIVNEPFWTPMATHADIIFPATITIEREDIGAGFNDSSLTAMHRIVQPVGEAKDDYEIFRLLSAELGDEDRFTDGRSTRDWLTSMFDAARRDAAAAGVTWPSFLDFWEMGRVPLPLEEDLSNSFGPFRADPAAYPLPTPSGKIEIFSETIASFGYDDCWGHPAWFPPSEGSRSTGAKRHPLQMVANQPATRLHSQLDVGATSKRSKIRDREPLRIHPEDAERRGLLEGDIARVFNDRGACLVGVRVTDAVRPGVVQLSTGAWYDPIDDAGTCGHGNPNVLTRDVGTSKLAQGCTGQLTRVDIERYDGPVPALRAHLPPRIVDDVEPDRLPSWSGADRP